MTRKKNLDFEGAAEEDQQKRRRTFWKAIGIKSYGYKKPVLAVSVAGSLL